MDTEIPMMQYQPSSMQYGGGQQQNPFGNSSSSSNNNNNDGSNNQQQHTNNNNNNNNNQNNNNYNIVHNEMNVIRYAGRQAVCTFLQNYNCWSILKISTKIIVFDIKTSIQLAFYALVEHDTLCAPLWDSQKCQFVGLFTVTDFIDLLYYYSCIIHKDVTLLNIESIADIILFLQSQQSQLQLQHDADTVTTEATSTTTVASLTTTSSVTTYNNNNNNNNNNVPSPPIGLFNLLQPFRGASTQCTLYRACIQLLESGNTSSNNNNSNGTQSSSSSPQNFLPVVFVDDMRVLSCITYTTILEFLVTHFREQRRLFDDSIYDLNIGTYGNKVIRVTTQHTLQYAIQQMSIHHLSAIPVLDATTNKIVAMYSRSDITFLTRAVDAEDAVRNLNLTLYDILNASSSQTTTTSIPPVSPSPITTTTTTTIGGTPPTAAASQVLPSQQLVTTPDALRTCLPSHTLQSIFESFAIQRFNRLCVVDENEQLMGIVSAKDLVAYFLSDTIPMK